MEWRFPRLKRKDKYYRLLHLTAEAGWVDFPEIVKEVQKIGATISDGRASPMNYQDANGIKVIDQESKRQQNFYYLLSFFIFFCYAILRSA